MATLNLGHRGASAYAPENTLAAFDLALQMGADGIELDVTLSQDGIPVVIHDDKVDRTTNGHGPIQQMTLAQIKRLDAGGWFSPKYCDERIPTLAQALELVGNRGIVNIELKGTAFRDDGLETAVGRVVEQAQAGDRVILSSFNPFALYRMAQVLPRVPRGLLYADDLPIFLRRAWLRPLARPTALHPKHSMISPAYVAWAHGKGYSINTWTVNEPDEMRRLIGLGIHAIITNKPDVLGRVLAQSGIR
jgi:glycerophosphoryl diester phosphodiesterase